jgi:gliding motility-associated-like protein
MRRIYTLLFAVLFVIAAKAQTSCASAQPFCAGNQSGLTFPATVNGPPAEIGPDYDCLDTQPNPAWYYLQISQAGNLSILIQGQINNQPGQDVDFICWGPYASLTGICSSLTSQYVVDCSYSPSPTETCNIPNALVGEYYMVLITNFSNVQQDILFTQIAGTGSTNCAILVNNTSICAGSSATLVAANNSNLGNPTYSMNPGGVVSPNPTFVVTPSVTTNYTFYITGTNNQNSVVTLTAVGTVTVRPSPIVSPTFTQSTCTNSINSVNLNLTFFPSNPVPGYTVTWNPIPPGILSGTQTTASNLNAGTTNVTVTTAGGCSTTVSFTMAPPAGPASFTINPPGNFSLTCTNTLITLTASPSNYTYTWISLSTSLTGVSATFTQGMQGTYTVTGTNPVGNCSTVQVVVIGQNTVMPTNTVSPNSQAITCNSGAPVTFSGTALSPTVNIQHDWYSPLNPLPLGVPIATSNNTISILSGAIPPGIYTLVTTNLVNGCTAQKTVTITSLSAWPTFSLASTTNFSVGCNPLNCTTLSIINPVSTQTPPATCSFSFLAPSFTGVVTPSVQLGATSSTVACIPGTWTVIVQDNSNFCRTTISVPVLQNTVGPHVMASMFTQTLTCYNPTVLATGTSTTPNTNVTWLVPSIPSLYSQPTVVIGDPQNGPATGTTSLNYASFTVVASNTLNSCQTTSVVVISQNFKKPISSPTISIATPTAIYCTVLTNPAVLTTGSSTTTSGGGPTAFVANPCWSGPSPQTSICGPSSYSCYISGIYTLEVTDNYNGCKNTGTVNVLDRTQPPVITDPAATATLDCGSSQGALIFALTGTMTGGVRYFVKQFPSGAAFSPNAAINFNVNPILSGTSSQTVMVDKTGTYFFLVTNTLTGCGAAGLVKVIGGNLNADFSADPPTGVAPLNVNFTNNSASSSNSSSITSVWNFGNGSSITNTTNASTSALYNAPGNYTVSLITKKGTCLDTAIKIIKVDMPSKLEVPNIFTPNGDGNNDVFFLKASNLASIEVFVFDRWGNKVYETNSTTGNIAWDGKNFSGKECASGVYFYVIKASGKDDKKYENKGNVTLMR